MDINTTLDLQQARRLEHFMLENGSGTPQSFFEMISATADEWHELNAYYKSALLEIKTKFDVLNEIFSVKYDHNPIESIKTRLKEPKSIYDKLVKQGNPLRLDSIEQYINDMAGIRVVCSFRDDIYLLANCVNNQDDITVLGVKDYIQHPKPNGYRSLHMIVEVPVFLPRGKRFVKVEVQLRTIAMDFWASLEHKIRYKKNIPEHILEQLGSDLRGTAEVANQLDVQMQSIRNDMRKLLGK